MSVLAAILIAVAVAAATAAATGVVYMRPDPGHRAIPGRLAGLGYALLRPLRNLRIRRRIPELRACTAEAGPDAAPPSSPASGAVPPWAAGYGPFVENAARKVDYRVRRDGVIIRAGGRVTAHTAPRIAPDPLRDTAIDGFRVPYGFRVPQWAPENSYDGAEVTG